MIFMSEEVENLAKRIHDEWMKEKMRQGWRYGPTKDPEKKTHPDLVPYDALTEEIKELDRMYIIDFEKILVNSGFTAIKGKDSEILLPEDIEKLSKASHELWLKKAEQQGRTNDPYFKPYEDLPEEAKELNRNTVKNLIKLIEQEGYGIKHDSNQQKIGNVFSRKNTETRRSAINRHR